MLLGCTTILLDLLTVYDAKLAEKAQGYQRQDSTAIGEKLSLGSRHLCDL